MTTPQDWVRSFKQNAEVQEAALAIVSHHPDVALPVVLPVALPVSGSPELVFTQDAMAYQASKCAAVALGFVEHDAQCVAKAWQAQTLRTGVFDATTWPTHPQDFGVPAQPRANAFPPCPELGLYAVLPDAAWCGRMARAGVPTVQLRFKSEDPQAIEREVQAAVKAVEGTGALLFINDHWQAAIRAGAYGVHLGQEDMAEAPIQTIREAGLRLGLSTHGYAEMLKADAHSPSYLALGAIYPTTLKRMATAPQGPGRLKRYAALMRHSPLVGIGGVDEARLPEVLASGVGSVAMVRQLIASDDPEATATKLIAIIGHLVTQP
jgi:thiamine-phosphate pyrophosphorylase